MNIILTQKQVDAVLNGLALAEMQMEGADGKKEMRDLGMVVYNQSKQSKQSSINSASVVRKQIVISMEGGVINSINANFKEPFHVMFWDNDEPDTIRESFAIPEGMKPDDYWIKVITVQYPYEVKF
jgi:hypothetical protein